MESDIICPTETQESLLSNSQHILQLSTFDMNFNNTEEKDQSISICSKNDTDITSHNKFCGAFYITSLKSTFESKIINQRSLSVLYRQILTIN